MDSYAIKFGFNNSFVGVRGSLHFHGKSFGQRRFESRATKLWWSHNFTFQDFLPIST